MTITESSDGTVELPIEFHAKKAGHYSCKVVLRSHDDVRVYQIECTVIPEGHEAQIEFSVALHQPLSQNIPIVSAPNLNSFHNNADHPSNLTAAALLRNMTIL